MTHETSLSLYTAKMIAIFCTVAAHMPYDGSASSWFSLLGASGVPLFFFISGLLFRSVGSDGFPYWFHFLKKVGSSWAFAGSISWIIGLWKGFHDSRNILTYILGYNTYLWFMTMSLFICFLFSYCLHKESWKICILCLTVLLSVFGSVWNITFFGSSYLVVWYWIPYFLLGNILQDRMGVENLFSWIKCHRITLICGFSLSFLFMGLVGCVDYFHPAFLLYGFFSIGGICSLGETLCLLCVRPRGERFVQQIGKNTLAIYLWHIYIAGFVSTRIPDLFLLHVMMSVVVAICTEMILLFGWILFNRFQEGKLYCLLTGLRAISKEE